MAERVCHACGERVAVSDPVPRDAECPRCGADLHACRNCRHYDTRVHNQCRETEAELVVDRHRRNFCEYFDYLASPYMASGGDRAVKARAQLEALFRKTPEGGGE